MADLSVRDVATRLATSDRTVRRYLAAGQLAGIRTADGWTVNADAIDRFLATRTVSPSSNGHAADVASGLSELVGLVDRLQSDLVAKAEAAAMWQARAEFLASQLEQAQLALPTSQERPVLADSERVPVNPSQTPPETRRAPWWMPWRRATA